MCSKLYQVLTKFRSKSIYSGHFVHLPQFAPNKRRLIDGLVQKDVTPLLMHWSNVFLALTHRYITTMRSAMTILEGSNPLLCCRRSYMGWIYRYSLRRQWAQVPLISRIKLCICLGNSSKISIWDTISIYHCNNYFQLQDSRVSVLNIHRWHRQNVLITSAATTFICFHLPTYLSWSKYFVIIYPQM